VPQVSRNIRLGFVKSIKHVKGTTSSRADMHPTILRFSG